MGSIARHLIKQRKSGRHCIYKILGVLCDTGYASRKPNPKGGWNWFIYEKPNAEIPNTENRNAENRNPDNQPLTNTDNKTNTEGECLERFQSFYFAYPKKRSKGIAEKTFLKIKPSEQLVGQMLSAIKRAKTSKEWLKDDGRFIPYPASWLNSKGWEDEIIEEKNGTHIKSGGQHRPVNYGEGVSADGRF